MSTIIALNGKGGTGKTTVASFLVDYLVSKKKGAILAIDADPNSCLADSLGVRSAETIVGTCDDISKNLDKIPAGVTKDRFIELRVQESLTEAEGFDLLVMGRPEGPGCYCYVNNLLRNTISNITKNYDFVVIDNAAGMEHISRRTMGDMNRLLLVSDYSVPGVRSAKKIYELAKEMKIRIGGAFLVVNKASGPLKALDSEISASGLELAGSLDYSQSLVDWNISNKPIFGFGDAGVKKGIEKIFENMMRENYANRIDKGKV